MRIKFLVISGSLSAIATMTIATILSPRSPATFIFTSERPVTVGIDNIDNLFATPTSLGSLAIGAAEGNYRRGGGKTSIYYGHNDPADGVENRGFCSDRGRGLAYLQRSNPNRKKFTSSEITQAADSECLKYIRTDLSKIVVNLKASGIDPLENVEVLVNAADLRNQANPSVHKRFVVRYAEAMKRKDVKNKISWARTMAFYVKGKWTSTGLTGICDRENRGLSAFDCTYHDQNRRQQEIYYVLQKFGY